MLLTKRTLFTKPLALLARGHSTKNNNNSIFTKEELENREKLR